LDFIVVSPGLVLAEASVRRSYLSLRATNKLAKMPWPTPAGACPPISGVLARGAPGLLRRGIARRRVSSNR
jgi:hypothetical protein